MISLWVTWAVTTLLLLTATVFLTVRCTLKALLRKPDLRRAFIRALELAEHVDRLEAEPELPEPGKPRPDLVEKNTDG